LFILIFSLYLGQNRLLDTLICLLVLDELVGHKLAQRLHVRLHLLLEQLLFVLLLVLDVLVQYVLDQSFLSGVFH
jgi:hypothetical protein